jgi:ethanolamine utilization protein EutN
VIIGRVIGTITSTINHAFYDAKKMLVVERIDLDGAPLADYVIAVDTVDAGAGDRVLVMEEGTGARQIFRSKDAPVRSVIVGILDAVDRT